MVTAKTFFGEGSLLCPELEAGRPMDHIRLRPTIVSNSDAPSMVSDLT